VPVGAPSRTPTAAARPGCRWTGCRWTARCSGGFPTPSGRLEFWSSTLAAWGWPEHALPGYIKSHVHPDRLAPDQVVLSTFRLPTQIHTRSANAKWLDELAHTNPVWIHPSDAARFGIAATGDLVRVETAIGYLTFPVHPDPISGMHCWHQAIRVRPADPADRRGDVAVDTAAARQVYRRWLALTRPAGQVTPDGTRRPRWLMRPLRPAPGAFRLPGAAAAGRARPAAGAGPARQGAEPAR
jgi:anaerobic selenocysteine-containing dehydrogenase